MKKSTKQWTFAAVFIAIAIAFALVPSRDGVDVTLKIVGLLGAFWGTFYTGALYASHWVDERMAEYRGDEE